MCRRMDRPVCGSCSARSRCSCFLYFNASHAYSCYLPARAEKVAVSKDVDLNLEEGFESLDQGIRAEGAYQRFDVAGYSRRVFSRISSFNLPPSRAAVRRPRPAMSIRQLAQS